MRKTRTDGDPRGALHASRLDTPARLTRLQVAGISHVKTMGYALSFCTVPVIDNYLDWFMLQSEN